MTTTLSSRYAGCLLGLACGDAVGTTLEFKPRGSFAPLTDLVGGGPFQLPAGHWTDDTSMALCLATSLLHCDGFDAHDQMTRYLAWWREGYLSSTGECFDIGNTVRQALARFRDNGDPWAGSAEPMAAGNGSLMRLAPIVLFFHPDAEAVDAHSSASSRTTHAASEAVECCRLFAHLLARALHGDDKPTLFAAPVPTLGEPRVRAIAEGEWRDKDVSQIRGSGYSVASLEAALWCFVHTDSYADAVLAAANLGEDADTTAAIVGQLAGAHYGVEGIPAAWRARLYWREQIEAMAASLLVAAQGRVLAHTPSGRDR